MRANTKNPIIDILSTKYSGCVLVFVGLLSSCASSGALLGMEKAKRLRVAIILAQQHASLTMELRKHTVQLRSPKIRFVILSWREFSAAYTRYDAMIYIALNSQLPSQHLVNEWIGPEQNTQNIIRQKPRLPEQPLFRLLCSPVLAKFQGPRSFIWLLFEEPADLDRYRLRYAYLPYVSSNTGKAALRKIFEEDLRAFIQNLGELYLWR